MRRIVVMLGVLVALVTTFAPVAGALDEPCCGWKPHPATVS